MENSLTKTQPIEQFQEGIIKKFFEIRTKEIKLVEYFVLNEYGQYLPVINPELIEKCESYTIVKYKYIKKEADGLIIMFAEIIKTVEPYKAVLVGIDNYDKYPLRGCVSGMDNLAEVLKQHYKQTLPLKKLTNECASKYSILFYLRNMIRNAKETDHLLFYFSGHGDNQQKDNKPIVGIASDCSNTITEDDLYPIINNLKEGKLTIVLDSCYSGGLPAQRYFTGSKRPRKQMVWILGCAVGKFSMTYPFPNGYSSIFTNCLIKELTQPSSRKSVNDLFDAVCDDVSKLDISQYPDLIGDQSLKQNCFLG